MDAPEFSRLQPGDVIVRRWDKSRWEVKKIASLPRPNSNDFITELVLRRITPEIAKTCEPLSWNKE